MRSRARRNYGITHSLTPLAVVSPARQEEPPADPKYAPLYTRNTFANPLLQRSRKHRLLEEKNTDIERENRRLYERLRRIKLKNAFQTDQPPPPEVTDPPSPTLAARSAARPLSLPAVGVGASVPSLGSTRSQLTSILNDRKTFVSKYFEELAALRGRAPQKTEELGSFVCNGWKVRALLLDEEFVLLRGRQGSKELTKKYRWEKVRAKMAAGLEDWVRVKFEFEE